MQTQTSMDKRTDTPKGRNKQQRRGFGEAQTGRVVRPGWEDRRECSCACDHRHGEERERERRALTTALAQESSDRRDHRGSVKWGFRVLPSHAPNSCASMLRGERRPSLFLSAVFSNSKKDAHASRGENIRRLWMNGEICCRGRSSVLMCGCRQG